MSQKTVHFIIGQLLTDEDLRLRFLSTPTETLETFRDQGFDLSRSEIEALVQTDRSMWTSGAERVHPRLQRCRIRTE
jgi:hypothetical protein